ncbi:MULTISPECIES: 5,6-dimethylbenzimidazole synthase [Microvirga]|uniref:Nitroreductase n=1 Tax=Microvirga lotononidis TaxID=864069 RepID=I4YK36_9HYPH|nr:MULTISPECIES: 5,6-dimethylbenzimidazole synthase [Microvirga]EIM24328.1 nitroreductase [Microvirga lotononidis]WQO30299.1 5,6-dimethylbenzimidazole synthase [Microvirga lotononidis]
MRTGRSPPIPNFAQGFRHQLRELFVWRRDVRHFRSTPISPDVLTGLLELAHLAPSVGLSQPWRFVLVENPQRRAAIVQNFEVCNAQALMDEPVERAQVYARLKLAGLQEAPVHLAVFAEGTTLQGHGLGRRTMPETVQYSAVMAIHTLWLAARVEGIGVGWVSILDPATVAMILEVPSHWTFIGYLCLGYPAHTDDTPELERQGWQARTKMQLLRR